MQSLLLPFTCLLLTFLIALHECTPFSLGCFPMLGISLICCAVLAEHVSSNASDSESSYRKLLLWFAVLLFAIAPLPVVVISDFCCCFSIAAFYHSHPKQMAWNRISIWCGKIQKTLGPSIDSSVIHASRVAVLLTSTVASAVSDPMIQFHKKGAGEVQHGGCWHSISPKQFKLPSGGRKFHNFIFLFMLPFPFCFWTPFTRKS